MNSGRLNLEQKKLRKGNLLWKMEKLDGEYNGLLNAEKIEFCIWYDNNDLFFLLWLLWLFVPPLENYDVDEKI